VRRWVFLGFASIAAGRRRILPFPSTDTLPPPPRRPLWKASKLYASISDIGDSGCVCSALLRVDKSGAPATTAAELKTLSDIAHILTHAERRPDPAECLHAEGLHDGAQREAGSAELNARL
jgi:hypothetical protein